MKWTPGYKSDDVEDRRGQRGMGGGGVGTLMSLAPILLRSKFGWVILLIGGALYFTGAFGKLTGGQAVAPEGRSAPDDPRVHFVSFVLDDVQNTWQAEFAREGGSYQRAKLVLFTDSTPTACGYGDAATGPFYCPSDRQVYLDLGFFAELSQRLGASGDFAQAYVIAHEVGHHVQKLLGLSDRVAKASPAAAKGASGASVRLELQADCFAGVWAHYTGERKLLEQGDLEEALNAAMAIGDDTLQRGSSGTVRPETFTHGSSAQRKAWFRRGYESGNRKTCDTFAATDL